MAEDRVKSAAKLAVDSRGAHRLIKSASVVDKSFKRAGRFFDIEDQDEEDIDSACPSELRIREGLWQKKCAGPQGGEVVIWKPRLAVLSAERLFFASQEHSAAGTEDAAETAQVQKSEMKKRSDVSQHPRPSERVTTPRTNSLSCFDIPIDVRCNQI